MKTFSIHITGVGGQGIGLLSEVLLRAADHAGWAVKGVDTHGLAQRGGIVVSQLRLGDGAHSPLTMQNRSDLVCALERHEALRGLNAALKDGGVLAYYDAVWQPLEVRIKEAEEVSIEALNDECRRRNVTVCRVFQPDLPDAHMQNMALLAEICKKGYVPRVEAEHYRQAMDDLMAGSRLKANRDLFDGILGE